MEYTLYILRNRIRLRPFPEFISVFCHKLLLQLR